jgi:RHS repeat-associated protein
VNSASTTNLIFDLNGNMTSDGTNAFAWDAENRMTKITYPGTNNFSTFVYDGKGRNVSIVETTAGSVTSTKQFIWCGNDRCEARNSSSAVTAQYFQRGEALSGTNYYWTKDHLGSVREMYASGTQAQYSYDPFGRVSIIASAVASDSGYGGYYWHSRSGLNLTRTRAYLPSISRWLTRDIFGSNRYRYVGNDPVGLVDGFGLLGSPSCEGGPQTGIPRQQFEAMINPEGDPQVTSALNRGCVGLTCAYQGSGATMPEDAPGTKCYLTEAEAKKHCCGHNFVFAKQGWWNNGEPPVVGSDGSVPNNSVQGAPGYPEGVFNYVTVLPNGCYAGMSGGGPNDTGEITPYPPAPSGGYPHTMWCSTCK